MFRLRRAGRARTGPSAVLLALALGCAAALAAPPAAADHGAPHGLPEAAEARQTPGAERPGDAKSPAPYGSSRARQATDDQLRKRLRTAKERAAAERAKDSEGSAGGGSGPAPYVIGGGGTTIESAPWMVQLGYYDEAAGESYFCGGALVAPNKVLTAAHCVAGLDWASHGSVLAGATNLDDTATGTLVGVHMQWHHPRYNPDTIKDDIAVLTLSAPLESAWLRLAASHDSALYTPGTDATVYGWGLTSGAPGSELSTTLRTARLPMVSDADCNTALGGVLGGDHFIEGSMTCAGTPASGTDEGTVSTCYGDSGGPLVVNGRIAGIVSWGVEGCTAEGAYPVFTKVSSYAWAAQPRVDDADLSFDGRADLLLRTPSGGLFEQDSTGSGLAQRSFLSHGWETVSWGLQADLDRDWYQDLIIRDSTDGRLYRNYLDHTSWEWTWAPVTTVWGGYRSYAIPGDLTGDARPDLVAVDLNGDTYLYPGRGNGEFHAKVKVVSGSWKGVKVYGHGDLSGDGKADLLVKDGSNTVWLYRGTGNAQSPWSARIQARTGWTFNAIVTNGDVTGDGIADLIAREPGTTGNLWLYKGTNKASADLFAPRVSLGTGFNQYNLLF